MMYLAEYYRNDGMYNSLGTYSTIVYIKKYVPTYGHIYSLIQDIHVQLVGRKDVPLWYVLIACPLLFPWHIPFKHTTLHPGSDHVLDCTSILVTLTKLFPDFGNISICTPIPFTQTKLNPASGYTPNCTLIMCTQTSCTLIPLSRCTPIPFRTESEYKQIGKHNWGITVLTKPDEPHFRSEQK